jgi:hypothetical protein
MEEHVLDNHALLSLDSVRRLALISEELLQFRRQVEDAPFHVLRGSRIQPNLAGLQINLSPLQRSTSVLIRHAVTYANVTTGRIGSALTRLGVRCRSTAGGH